MSMRINVTGCVVTVSEMTGDVLCRVPGLDCDCLMSRDDASVGGCDERHNYVEGPNESGLYAPMCDRHGRGGWFASYGDALEVLDSHRDAIELGAG